MLERRLVGLGAVRNDRGAGNQLGTGLVSGLKGHLLILVWSLAFDCWGKWDGLRMVRLRLRCSCGRRIVPHFVLLHLLLSWLVSEGVLTELKIFL